jgi:hypothetical protein
MKNIADEVKGKKIWVSVDETTDVMGRMIGNALSPVHGLLLVFKNQPFKNRSEKGFKGVRNVFSTNIV